MSKELETLEKLMNGCCNTCTNDICETRKNEACPNFRNYKIIESSLKRKQDLQQILYKMNVKHGYKEYLKISKVLDILKEKKWLVEDIVNAFIEDKDKYDLLKEALL